MKSQNNKQMTSLGGEERLGDSVYVRLRLTLKGVSRENVAEGGDPKSACSDALKRCAMLFGVGRYLYDSSSVWTDYDESQDRFRQWSVSDYEAATQGRGGAVTDRGARPERSSATAARETESAPAPTQLSGMSARTFSVFDYTILISRKSRYLLVSCECLLTGQLSLEAISDYLLELKVRIFVPLDGTD